MDTEKMIARLMTRRTGGAFDLGRRAGEAWAEGRAEEDELRRLDDASTADGFDTAAGYAAVHPDIATAIARTASGSVTTGRAVEAFWAAAFGVGGNVAAAGDQLFARGFVAGALAAWRAVRHEFPLGS